MNGLPHYTAVLVDPLLVSLLWVLKTWKYWKMSCNNKWDCYSKPCFLRTVIDAGFHK